MSNSGAPSCFGFFGKPIAPNNCQKCTWVSLCQKVVAKQRLQPLIAKILEAKQILQGETR